MRWKAISEAKDLPNEEYYEYPPVYILRGKIDDPRAGWQVVQCTVVDMLDVAKQFDYAEYLDESPSSDPAEIELPFMNARGWSDADKAKLVEETMRLSAAPIMNTMAMLGINNLMRCEVVNHATGHEYIFSFQRKETKADPAEVLVVALKEIASPISRLTKKEIKYLAVEGLKSYEQLKQKQP